MLIFDEDMKNIIKEALEFRNYDNEALMMTKLVKLFRNEVFNHQPSLFDGSFSKSCQIDSVSQNSKKSAKGACQRHSIKRDPPLPLYVRLNVHTSTRSKKIVDNLHRLGLSVSYNRVRKLEDSLANAVCYRYRQEDLVCPATLRKGLFTIGAFDNIDYNPSSSTATGSFHGTGISVFQFPLVENSGESITVLCKSYRST